MTEHVDERILSSADETIGHFFFVLRKALMNTGDHHVEFGQQLVIEIEFPFTQNVHFGAGEQTTCAATASPSFENTASQKTGTPLRSVEFRHYMLDLGVVLKRIRGQVLAVAGLLVAPVRHL